MITVAPQCISLYNQKGLALLREAVRGGGRLCEQAHRSRAQILSRMANHYDLRQQYSDLARKISYVLDRYPSVAAHCRISEQDFLKINGHLVPILREPSFFLQKIASTATDVIGSLSVLRPLRRVIRDIFLRSVFKPGFLRYRTTSTENGPMIEGEDVATIRAVASVAHELGHCLAEGQHLRFNLNSIIGSEATAHVFEEWIVKEFLLSTGAASMIREWNDYQRKVDAVNWYYFAVERFDLFSEGDLPHIMFEPNLNLFRESLYVYPGYQRIHARASLARLNWLNADRKIKDFLSTDRSL
jgi:hypothetical protein